MAFELYYHPLASYCWKALVALYEVAGAANPRITSFGCVSTGEPVCSAVIEW